MGGVGALCVGRPGPRFDRRIAPSSAREPWLAFALVHVHGPLSQVMRHGGRQVRKPEVRGRRERLKVKLERLAPGLWLYGGDTGDADGPGTLHVEEGLTRSVENPTGTAVS